MAVQASATSGYDPAYPGHSVGPVAERSPGGYYLNAAQKGEPPGRWFGRGAEALGLAAGSTVDAEVHDAVFDQADPRTGEKLGRGRPGNYGQKKMEKFHKLLAAEPWATAERRRELWREAAAATPPPGAVHGCHSELQQIDLGAARVDQGERAAGPDGRRH